MMDQKRLCTTGTGKPSSHFGVLRGQNGSVSFRSLVIFLILLAILLFFFRTPGPCKEPLTYRIGAVDERFGLSRDQFSSLVGKAASVWGEPLNRDLFREEPDGKIVVELIYDYRQDATDKLKRLNYVIGNTRDSYDGLKDRHESLKTEYEQKRDELEGDFQAYNARVEGFNTENETGRRRGGLTQEAYNCLMEEKAELASLRTNLQLRQNEINKLVETMNSLVVVINEIAAAHNLEMVRYRDEGEKLGGEFSKGRYTLKGMRETITIYQFDGEESLIRVLVHEFGHALGLDHSEDPHAVMNRLVHDEESFALTAADIMALKERCGED
ncbi:MAG: matrixin family metalloprotease [Syntrophaceae bacterium]|nr:matrixin family metalloprotease [Syntrophaceae bacterium]